MPDDAERAHRVQAAVPGVEVADDRDRARVRRPDRERRADDAVDLAHVRAELLVELARAGPPSRGAGRARRASAGTHTDRAACTCSRPRSRPRARTRAAASPSAAAPPRARRILQLGSTARLRLHAHRLRLGPVRAHDDAALRLVRAEDPCGSAPSSIIWAMSLQRPARCSRRMPATGMPTQSGRLSSSYRNS